MLLAGSVSRFFSSLLNASIFNEKYSVFVSFCRHAYEYKIEHIPGDGVHPQTFMSLQMSSAPECDPHTLWTLCSVVILKINTHSHFLFLDSINARIFMFNGNVLEAITNLLHVTIDKSAHNWTYRTCERPTLLILYTYSEFYLAHAKIVMLCDILH